MSKCCNFYYTQDETSIYTIMEVIKVIIFKKYIPKLP